MGYWFAVETVQNAFEQMKSGSSEFDAAGNLVGFALTLISTPHRFRIDGRILYAWCALDTLFLPALIGQTAYVESTCPVTDTPLHLTVSPARVEGFTPSQTVLSIVIPDLVEECNTRDSFCNHIHFFSSRESASRWITSRPGIAIFSVEAAYQIARAVYIDPLLKHV